MPQLFDRIIREGYFVGHYEDDKDALRSHFDELLSEAVIVEAPSAWEEFITAHFDPSENMYHIIFSSERNPEVECVTAPYPVTWLEWKDVSGSMACLVEQTPVDHYEGGPVSNLGVEKAMDVHVWVFAGFKGLPPAAPFVELSYLADAKTGALLREKEMPALTSFVPERLSREQPEYTDKLLEQSMGPAYLTMAVFNLLNCNNVELEPVTRNPQLQRRAERRFTRSPLPRYHTIVIRTSPKAKPVPALQYEKVEDGVMPWHRVRRHYHRYGPEYNRGLLFGKYSGRFAIPQHARGSKKNGIVVADYRLEGHLDGRPDKTAGA